MFSFLSIGKDLPQDCCRLIHFFLSIHKNLPQDFCRLIHVAPKQPLPPCRWFLLLDISIASRADLIVPFHPTPRLMMLDPINPRVPRSNLAVKTDAS